MTAPIPPVEALLIVDIQADGVTGDRAVPAAATLLKNVTALLERARQAGAFIVHLQNDGKPGAGDEPGTVGWQLYLPVQPRAILAGRRRTDTTDSCSGDLA